VKRSDAGKRRVSRLGPLLYPLSYGVVVDDEASIAEGAVDSRDKPIDGIRRQPEEIQVARLPANVASGDQRGAAGECEAFRFLEACDDLSDLHLERAEHLRGGRWRSTQPVHARRTACGRTSSSQSSRS
jgi:hypothetical protein